MQFEKETLKTLPAALRALEEGFAALPAIDTPAPGQERIAEVMQQVAVRLRDNYPYFHPFYAGQMLKPPHPIARVAKARWRVEQDYRELKEELGLDHYEGRQWLGWHHHVCLVTMAYGFLRTEQARLKKHFWCDLDAAAGSEEALDAVD
jgi:hypothetical protein